MNISGNISRRMPAEWEPHRATWVAWPHHSADWPGKFEVVRWVYVEIVRAIGRNELVEILCNDKPSQDEVRELLLRSGVSEGAFRLHVVPTDRSWLRDSAPSWVEATGEGQKSGEWIGWSFNGWAKYDNFTHDRDVPLRVSEISSTSLVKAEWPGEALTPVVLEGGAIDTDGAGTLLTTEECLLSEVQQRNAATREGYEALFRQYLGITQTIWLGRGIVGDDTHGHIDDIARFVAPGTVVACVERDEHHPNYELLQENLRRLRGAHDAAGKLLEVIELPMPETRMFDGERLPASYANFYIANASVVVPVFNAPQDLEALRIIEACFPGRNVIPIHGADLILGLGTLHCLTQQEPVLVG